ncbi:hypothetical protein GOV09_03540 [Candidatus Woesearchaeota archaeon]|nr:hypothetical protein [Candidatus Woesearchaeota archaeon]
MKHYTFNRDAGENSFWLASGEELSTIKDLYHELAHMSDDTFNTHVNAGKNDFANWVDHVFEEHTLSSKLVQASTRDEMKTALGSWMHDIIHESSNIRHAYKKTMHHAKTMGEKVKEHSQKHVSWIFSKDHPLRKGMLDFLLGFFIGALSVFFIFNAL